MFGGKDDATNRCAVSCRNRDMSRNLLWKLRSRNCWCHTWSGVDNCLGTVFSLVELRGGN